MDALQRIRDFPAIPYSRGFGGLWDAAVALEQLDRSDRRLPRARIVSPCRKRGAQLEAASAAAAADRPRPREIPPDILSTGRRLPHHTERLDQACLFAAEKHRGQKRKGPTSLHHTPPGGDHSRARSARRRGGDDGRPAPRQGRGPGRVDRRGPSAPRRRGGRHSSRAAVPLVSCADKLHNAHSIVADLREQGSSVWERFNVKPGQMLWYYDGLVKAFRQERLVPARLIDELDLAGTEMHRLSRARPVTS